MGMLTNNRASNTSVVNMTPSEKMLKEQLAFLNSHGITNPQDAVKFMLDVIENDKQTISAEFQSLREDNLDEPISAIETAASIYNRESARNQKNATALESAMNMLEKAIRTLLRRTQRYVNKVMEIDQTPKWKILLSPFHQLTAQVDNYSFCARICFENAIAGMTYARAIDAELGGNYATPLINTFNECVNSLTDGNRRCWLMSQYAANDDLEAFWLEIPEASARMINSGDWNRLAQIAEQSTHTQIASAQIAVNDAKPGLFARLKKWLSGFIQRLVFLFTGKPFEEQKPQDFVNNKSLSGSSKPSGSLNAESEAGEPDYEHIVF